MINLIYICLIIAFAIILKIIFGVNLKKMKELSKENPLDNLTARLPNNEEIGKDMLKILKNKSVKIEKSVDEKSQTSLYLITGNKIIIADNNKSFARVQTMAHECLHSIQNKNLLWFNFAFSNCYIVLTIIVYLLTIFGIIKNTDFYMFLLCFGGFIFFIIRSYLEIDAMTKAKYLAKEYLESTKKFNDMEINELIIGYDEINKAGIPTINYMLVINVLRKMLIYSVIILILGIRQIIIYLKKIVTKFWRN